MNIHLPAILMFTRGTGFWPIPIYVYMYMPHMFLIYIIAYIIHILPYRTILWRLGTLTAFALIGLIWFSKTYQGCCLPNWRFKTKRWHPKFEPRYCAVGDWGQGPIIQRQAGTLLFHMVLGWFPTLFKSVLGSTNESALVAPLRSISIS